MSVESKSEATPPRRFAGSIVVMGVSGSGKSSVGEAISEACGYPSSKATRSILRKTSGKCPRDSAHGRRPLAVASLRSESSWRAGSPSSFPAPPSSAATGTSFRESTPGGLAFVFLHGSESVLAERMHHRTGHFMPSSLLQTQLATLEDPTGEVRTVAVDVPQPLAEIVREALAGLARL